jgi:predicted O-linked N-acetylglucosamine transferase (SPINDLY family)
MGGSILKSLDMDELITQNEKQYEALIVDLANDPERLLEIKRKLKQRAAQAQSKRSCIASSLENQIKSL